MNNRGFTFVEIVISMAIIGVIAVLAIPSYGMIRDNVALNNDRQEIINALRIAQNRSIVSLGGEAHGVYFATSSYILYDGSWPATSHETEYILKSGIEIYTGIDTPVEFSRLTGDTGSTTVIFGPSPDKVNTVLVQPGGEDNYELKHRISR